MKNVDEFAAEIIEAIQSIADTGRDSTASL